MWTGRTDSDGYGIVSNTKSGEMRAHRFSMELEIGRRLKSGEHVLHKCDRPGCVNPKHLYIGTPKDNTSDMDRRKRRGRVGGRGERNGHARLTWEQVRFIRKIAQMGICTNLVLAARFNIGADEISRIKNNRIWKE